MAVQQQLRANMPTLRAPGGGLQTLETMALLLAAAAAFYAVWSIALRLGATPPVGPVPNWVDCLAMLIAAALPLAWEVGVRKASLGDVGFRLPAGNSRSVAVSFGLIAAFAGYASMLFGLLGLRTVHLLSMEHFGGFAAPALCIAAAEEVLFRGVFQRRLTTAHGPVPAIMATALVFALLAHARAPLAMNLALRFPAGLLLGCLYHRHASLIPPIALHWAINIAALA